MMVTLGRTVRFAGQNFIRNIWLSVLTTSILALALLSVNALITLNVLARAAVQAVEERIDVSVYFKPEASEEIVSNARSYLLSLPQVATVEYTSPEVALAKLKERHAGSELVQESVKELEKNPLGATLAVKARDPGDYPAILAQLENPTFAPYIAEKNFGDHRKIIERIQTISLKVKRAALAVSLLFTLIAALIVFNSIRVAIYTRREEIGIMRLVGASNAFIRTPFLVESIFYSALATLLVAILVLPALAAAGPALARFFDSSAVNVYQFFIGQAVPIFTFELLGATALSMATASFAVGRYLNV